MANPMKGEVLVKVEAGEFTLAYTLGACAAIEGQFPGRSLNEILSDLDGEMPKISTMLVVVWAGLKKHHSDLTQDQVGDLVSLHELETWGAKLSEALNLAQPEANRKTARPRQAAARK
ncbi:MAG: hypothetical protein EOP24_27680 [Hyphomicrobiales bacterium]|nr:MAG: hypothetical protein EOP24_27680 [Hyphomicrobiales bacterium]